MGSAIPGIDYTAFLPTTITFPAGSLDGEKRSIELEVLQDTVFENLDNIQLELTNPSGSTILDTTVKHLVTIVDDDPLILLLFVQTAAPTVREANTVHPISVLLNIVGGGNLHKEVSVDVVVNGGTATPGEDFSEFVNNTLIFPAGSKSGTIQSFNLNILQDDEIEGKETIKLVLTNIRGRKAHEKSDPMTIIIDDTQGVQEMVFWTDLGTSNIQRMNQDGSKAEEIVPSVPHPACVAVDGVHGKVYWDDFQTGAIRRANLDGTQVENYYQTGNQIISQLSIAPTSGVLFWAETEDPRDGLYY